jgi:hypothetical protein
MPTNWRRIQPGNAPAIGQIQAVAAKKHLTVFLRSPSAPGAGSPEQKAKFSRCAHSTKGTKDRMERNIKMAACLGGKTAKAAAK